VKVTGLSIRINITHRDAVLQTGYYQPAPYINYSYLWKLASHPKDEGDQEESAEESFWS
jgi:hypothetical protein